MHIRRLNGRRSWYWRWNHLEPYFPGDGHATLSCGEHESIPGNDLSVQCFIKILFNGDHECALCTVSRLLSDNSFLYRRHLIESFSEIHRETISSGNDSLPRSVHCSDYSPNQLLIQ